VLLEDRPSAVDRRELKILFGCEVGVQAALAHLHRCGEATDGDLIESVDGRQVRGAPEDRGAQAPTSDAG
jgi:hypothetical protein